MSLQRAAWRLLLCCPDVIHIRYGDTSVHSSLSALPAGSSSPAVTTDGGPPDRPPTPPLEVWRGGVLRGGHASHSIDLSSGVLGTDSPESFAVFDVYYHSMSNLPLLLSSKLLK